LIDTGPTNAIREFNDSPNNFRQELPLRFMIVDAAGKESVDGPTRVPNESVAFKPD
jgi:hypothetical protein